MRRSVLGSVALLGVFLAGCEDGPNQPYSPAGAGFAGNSNNAGPDAGYNDPGTQAYDAGGGGTNSVNICTAAQQNVQWSKAFEAPLIPPFGVGGIDLSAGGTFANVTIEDVLHGTNGQAQLCQGSSVACSDGTGFPSYAWGPSQQLQACYDPASHNLTFFLMLPGYDGKATFTLPKLYNGQPVPLAIDPTSGQPADLNFVWQMGQPITVNGQVLKGKNGAALWSSNGIDDQAANQMYLGMMYTFQPTLIAVTNPTRTPPLTEMTDPTADCLSVAKCRTSANADSSGGNFGVRAAGIYFDAAELAEQRRCDGGLAVGHVHVSGQVRAVLAGSVQRGARHLPVAHRGPEPALQRRPDLRPVLSCRRPLEAGRRHADALLHALHGWHLGRLREELRERQRRSQDRPDVDGEAAQRAAPHGRVVPVQRRRHQPELQRRQGRADRLERPANGPAGHRVDAEQRSTSRPTSTSTSVPAARS